MKTNIHFWSYLTHFFLEWEMFQTNFVEEIKTRLVFSNYFFPPKLCRLWDNERKYGRAGQATDDNIIRRMRIACRVTKGTDAHTEYVIIIAFAGEEWLRERASFLHYTHIICLILSESHHTILATL
jgi:hypothetical protein